MRRGLPSGLRAANYLYNFAPNDGTAIGMFARTVPLLGLLGDAKRQRVHRKFFPIRQRGLRVCEIHLVPIDGAFYSFNAERKIARAI